MSDSASPVSPNYTSPRTSKEKVLISPTPLRRWTCEGSPTPPHGTIPRQTRILKEGQNPTEGNSRRNTSASALPGKEVAPLQHLVMRNLKQY
jgi:hypothetical protein